MINPEELTVDILIKKTGGNPTKYHRETHFKLLMEVMKAGKGVEDFCAQAVICKKTFYEWLKANSEFRQAYDILMNFSEAVWMNYPLNDPNFNMTYWNSVMRAKFGFGKAKTCEFVGKTLTDKIDSAWQMVNSGDWDINEYGYFMNSLLAESRLRVLDKISESNIPIQEMDQAMLNNVVFNS